MAHHPQLAGPSAVLEPTLRLPTTLAKPQAHRAVLAAALADQSQPHAQPLPCCLPLPRLALPTPVPPLLASRLRFPLM